MMIASTLRLLACSVCFAADQQSRGAYYLATGVLLLVPFLALGGLIFWIAQSMRTSARSSKDS